MLSNKQRLLEMEARLEALEERARWRAIPRFLVADVTGGILVLELQDDYWFVDLYLPDRHDCIGGDTPQQAIDRLLVYVTDPTNGGPPVDPIVLTEIRELRDLCPPELPAY